MTIALEELDDAHQIYLGIATALRDKDADPHVLLVLAALITHAEASVHGKTVADVLAEVRVLATEFAGRPEPLS